MELYLPIAGVSVNIILILFLSFVVGLLSGIFGVGGGFLMTPFLIFMGVPPTYAVPNEVNNILATSVSGSLTHWFKNTLDYKMGSMIVVGGVFGTIIGIITFTYFKEIGKISLIISLAYMYLLAIIGTLMLLEGVAEVDRERKKIVLRKKLHNHNWLQGLPFRMRFKKSKLYESAFTPIIMGFIVGYIAAILGVGGAFILVPAMIYIIGMPTKLIPGTSLFVTIFISAIVTILHAFNYGTIDLILVTVLILGSILGVQIGQKIGEKVDSSQFKTILAMLLLLVGIAIAYDTFFVEEVIKQTSNNGSKTLGPISQFVRDLSKNVPVLYGLFSIVLALVLGVGAAILRRFLSNLKKKFVYTAPPASQK